MSSKDLGADELCSRASRQVAGELAAACETVAAGVIDSPCSCWTMLSTEAIAEREKDLER